MGVEGEGGSHVGVDGDVGPVAAVLEAVVGQLQPAGVLHQLLGCGVGVPAQDAVHAVPLGLLACAVHEALHPWAGLQVAVHPDGICTKRHKMILCLLYGQ